MKAGEKGAQQHRADPSQGWNEGLLPALLGPCPCHTFPSMLGSFGVSPWVSEWVRGAACGAGITPTPRCPFDSPSVSLPAGASSPRYISRDWQGVPSRLDAAMAGRIYVATHQPRRRKSRRQRKRYKNHRSLNLGFWGWLENDSDSAGVESDWLSGSKCETLQSVYFFAGGESGAAGSG